MRLFYMLLIVCGLATARRDKTPYTPYRRENSIAPINSSSTTLTGEDLRILPLRASITYGYHSTSGNGYRLELENMLSPVADVTYVGSQCSGNMTNGNNEGHPEYLIGNMQSVGQPSLPLSPNVVLIYVGTNDMLYPVDPANAPQRMRALIQYLTNALPDAVIIASTLFIETDPVVQARIDTPNQQMGLVVDSLAADGTKTLLADFSEALTIGDLWCDGEHPIDSGYAKMANVFYGALGEAAGRGWITRPATQTVAAVQCKPTSATGTGFCTSKLTSATSSKPFSILTTTTASPTASPHPTTVSSSTTLPPTGLTSTTHSSASIHTSTSIHPPISTHKSSSTHKISSTAGHKITTTTTHKSSTTVYSKSTTIYHISTTSRRANRLLSWWE